ncbi:MAG: hypothetical protein Q8O66_03810 [bacterium]|nr:hypothetical protein [bacterium]
MRTVTTVVVFGLIIMVSSVLFFVNFWSALICFPILTILFVKNGIKNIPANPPHKGILVFIGKRQEVVLNEGWNFVPLYPWIFSFILIKVVKVNHSLQLYKIRTPDKAEVSITVSFTWIPGIKETSDSYITYLNSGGEEGVKKNINSVIEDHIRNWAILNRGGPTTWMEAQATEDGVYEVLVRAFLGDIKDIKKIRRGRGDFGYESLGITIIMFALNEVKVEGKIAIVAELEEKKRMERAADKMEIANVSKRIQKLRKDNPEMSLEDAVRIVQTERGKISKTVIEVLGASTGLGQDVLAGLGLQKMPNGGGGVASAGNSGNQGGRKKKLEDMTREEKRQAFEELKKEKGL